MNKKIPSGIFNKIDDTLQTNITKHNNTNEKFTINKEINAKFFDSYQTPGTKLMCIANNT